MVLSEQKPNLTITDNEENYSCPAAAAKNFQEDKDYYQVMKVNGKIYVQDVTGTVEHFASQGRQNV